MDKKARKALRKSVRDGTYKKMDAISIEKRRKKNFKKKFNAYLNPGTDEAEFSHDNKIKKEKGERSRYQDGGDKVKKILDKNKEDDD